MCIPISPFHSIVGIMLLAMHVKHGERADVVHDYALKRWRKARDFRAYSYWLEVIKLTEAIRR